MLFDNGRVNEAVVSYRRAAQLLPATGIIKVDFARTLIESNKPENDREAIRNLELAATQGESGNFELWRLEAAAYSRMNNPGMTSLARAEMAVLRGNRAEAQAHAAAAEHALPRGTPAWQRAQDLTAYIDSRPRKR
jgi:predicted Zn-dependent protease